MKFSSILALSILLSVGTVACRASQEIDPSTTIIEVKKRGGRVERKKKQVVAVYLGGKEFEDEDLERLHLQNDNGITDEGMRYLTGFDKLRTLDLFETQVGDKGLEHVKELTNLTQLMLSDQITDAGLAHLANLENLVVLSVENSQITDDGLVHLKGLKSLVRLSFVETRISDAGLKHLDGLSNLKDLEVSRAGVTDAGIDKLKQALPNCRVRR